MNPRRNMPKRGRKTAPRRVAAFSPNAASPTSVPPVIMNPKLRLVIDARAHPLVDTVYSRTYADWMNYAFQQRNNRAPVDLATAPPSAATWMNIRIRKVLIWGPTGGTVEVLRASSIAVPNMPVKFDEGAAGSDRPFVDEPFPPTAWASKVVGALVNDTVVPFQTSVHVGATDETKTQTNVIVHVHCDVW